MPPDVQPLAFRMRPCTLQEFVGQEHILGPGMPLRSAIEQDALSSVILAGPPGTGKTTLANVIAQATSAQFMTLNAVMSGVKDLKAVCGEAEQIFTSLAQRTVLFIDEIHRFNKSQQDALLPYVESGTVILIGATTENPYFEVNAALVSRSGVYLLRPLSEEHLVAILQHALADARGYGGAIRMDNAAVRHLAAIANGDARIALNALELSVMTIGKKISLRQAEQLFLQRAKRYDAAGEDHYNTSSAFIKTLRGSDPDAALVWLFAMVGSGEHPRFIFRRMAIFASEDIGNADPRALQIVMAAWDAFERVGLPEGEYFLAHACIYLAQAPKSNAIKRAMDASRRAVERASSLEVPNHLRNAPVKAMRTQHGYSEGYQYPHDAEEGIVQASYFPIGWEPQDFYSPTVHGYEEEVRQRLARAKTIIRQRDAMRS